MPRYTAEQIYAFARTAGFSPDQSATMTAIALAESGGDSRAHNTHGEDSQGLWQINADAHSELAQQFDLDNPVQNAQAAFVVSRGGTDVSPWTTTHNGGSARYLRFQEEAQAAAAAYGDGDVHGMWSGTSSYGDARPAGADTGDAAADRPQLSRSATDSLSSTGSDAAAAAQATEPVTTTPIYGHAGEAFGIPLDNPADAQRGVEYGIPLDESGTAPGAQGASTETKGAPAGHDTAPPSATGQATGDALQTFLTSALAQTGDRYIYGVEVALDDPNPTAFDCSELVEWAAHQAGVQVPDGAWAQYQHLQEVGALIPVDEAIHTPGALLFSFSGDPNGPAQPSHAHVAISLGDGKTIEAYGTEYGVGSFNATTMRFGYAAVIPGIFEIPGGGSNENAHDIIPEPAVDDFNSRLALDPNTLDADPQVLANSLDLADTPETPQQPDVPDSPELPETLESPEGVVPADTDADGFDESLARAMEWTSHIPDTTDPDTTDEAHHGIVDPTPGM